MGENVFKGIEIVGTSNESFSQAIEVAVRRARQSLRDLSWFVVKEQRGGLQQGRLEYQVTLDVFFKLEDGDSPEEDAVDDLRDALDKGRKTKKKRR